MQRMTLRILQRGTVVSPRAGWEDLVGKSRGGEASREIGLGVQWVGTLGRIFNPSWEQVKRELEGESGSGSRSGDAVASIRKDRLGLGSGGLLKHRVWKNNCVDTITFERRGTLLSSNVLLTPVSATWQKFYSTRSHGSNAYEIANANANNVKESEPQNEANEKNDIEPEKKEEGAIKPEEKGWFSKVIGEAKLLIKAYMAGAGSLGSGIKQSAIICAKRIGLSSSEAPRWKEERTLYNTSENLKQSLPVFVLFMVPLLGNTVPLITMMFPQILHPSFRTEKQQLLLKAAFESNSKKGSNFIYQIIDKLRMNNRKFSAVLLSLVEEHFSFPSMTKAHIQALANCFPTTFTNFRFTTKFQLKRRLYKLAHLLINEDPDLLPILSDLSIEELKNLAETRGFHFETIVDEAKLKEILISNLSEWLQDSEELRAYFERKYGKDYATTHFEKVACTYLHLLAFFTHIPPGEQ